MKITYIAAYLSSKYDHFKNTQQQSDNFEYIRQYYESIVKLKLNCVIIVDNISDEFIKKYSNEYVSFYKPITKLKWDNIMHIHDLRFFYFLEYMIQDKTSSHFMLTDISDVTIINPIENIIDINDYTIYVSKENENILINEWFIKTFINGSFVVGSNMVNDFIPLFYNKIMLNCGIIFGHKELLITFLSQLTGIMNCIYKQFINFHSININDKNIITLNSPLDMFLTNYIIYKYYLKELYGGNLLHTKFGHYMDDVTKCIKHK